MSVRLSIKSNIPEVARALAGVVPQTRGALARALTQTGWDVRHAVRQEMRRVFDNPTPWTLNGVFVKRATTLNLETTVWLRDDRANRGNGIAAAQYLPPEIEGGHRNIKRFERALQINGLMPKGWFSVIGFGARLDAYGNISRGQIVQILSQLRAQSQQANPQGRGKARSANALRRAGGTYFVIRPGGRACPGIYQRELDGKSIKPIILFVQNVVYKKRYDFYIVGNKRAAERFPKNFAKELNNVIKYGGI